MRISENLQIQKFIYKFTNLCTKCFKYVDENSTVWEINLVECKCFTACGLETYNLRLVSLCLMKFKNKTLVFKFAIDFYSRYTYKMTYLINKPSLSLVLIIILDIFWTPLNLPFARQKSNETSKRALCDQCHLTKY